MRAVERFEWINWGTTTCGVRGCRELAEAWFDGVGAICIGCADDWLDHAQAVAEARRSGSVPAFLELGFWKFDDPEGVLPTGLE